MAQYPQSWFKNSARVWFGYLLTAVSAIPASGLGWFLLGRGLSRLSAILASISIAVFLGFAAEGIIYLWTNKRIEVTISLNRRYIIVITPASVTPKTKPVPAINDAFIRLV
jgi:hypothetical protein